MSRIPHQRASAVGPARSFDVGERLDLTDSGPRFRARVLPDSLASSIRGTYAATEFQVQGLEVDWGVVTWDADLRANASGWGYHDFRGSRWINVNKDENQRYLLNAYRVLLTRARQGMVIFVPPGNQRDRTRTPELHDGTFGYLRDLGVPALG